MKNAPTESDFKPIDEVLAGLEREQQNDRKIQRWSLLAALFVHVVLLLIIFPEVTAKPKEVARAKKIYLVQPVRFQPPPPRQQREIPKRKTKKIPIPDPTPDEPEPLVIEEVNLPEIDLADLGDVVFGIPDAPPRGLPGDPMQVSGDVMPPQKILYPPPRYTEEARQARIQGVVILQTIIDTVGNVTDVEVIKGLPLGLSESAIEAVSEWKFRPATLEGMPVAVFFHLTVSFRVQ
ncbi:MAG: TonB family protein [bacterium]|nr:TonB family protein [bacterium]